MLGLHGAPGHFHQVFAQGIQVRLVSQPGVEGGKRLCGIVLPAVEAAIHERLHPLPQRAEQGGNDQGGGDDRQGGLLTGEDAQGTLQADQTPDVHQRKHRGGRSIDEGTVDDEIYVVEAIPQHGDAYGYVEGRVGRGVEQVPEGLCA